MASSTSQQQNLDSFLQRKSSDAHQPETSLEPAWKVDLVKKVSSSKSIADLKQVILDITGTMESLYHENKNLKAKIISLENNLEKNIEHYDDEIARLSAEANDNAQYSELTTLMDKVDDLENRSRKKLLRH